MKMLATKIPSVTASETQLGWKANETFDTGIIKTVERYLNKYGINR